MDKANSVIAQEPGSFVLSSVAIVRVMYRCGERQARDGPNRLAGSTVKSKPPTIMDVARRADVSVGTVSNVMSGRIRVSEARRERVLKAIADLGYTQNLMAQGLRRRLAPLVGLCVPFTSISYFSALVDAFEDVAADRGFEIMQVLSHQDSQTELQRVKALLRYHVAGIMLVPNADPQPTLDLITASGTPVVVVDRPVPDHTVDEVTFNNFDTMVEAATRLIALGHRRIVFIFRNPKLSVTIRRIEGLREATRRAGDGVEIRLVRCGYEESSFIARLSPELAGRDRPTAVIASNSTIAAWTYRAFRTLGVRCPDEVSLLAFDEPPWADLVQPSLSVIRQPIQAIALTAWDFLIRRMQHEADTVQRAELRAEIVFRDSVGPARAAVAPHVAVSSA